MEAYPAELEEHWQAGGEPVLIRPIRPTDAAQHEAFFHRLTPEEIRFRFFAAIRELTQAQLERMTRPDYEHDIAFIAVHEATGGTIGVARLARTEDPSVAEFAVSVERDFQGRGLGTRLVQRLLAWAPAHGIREVVGQILSDNKVMLGLAHHLGFRLHQPPANPLIVEARLSLPPATPKSDSTRG